MDFKDKLNKMLKERNISQAELSRQTGLSRGAITHYIKGDNFPTIKNLIKISEVLQLPGYHLLLDDSTEYDLFNPIEFLQEISQLTKNNKFYWSIKSENASSLSLLNSKKDLVDVYISYHEGNYINIFNNGETYYCYIGSMKYILEEEESTFYKTLKNLYLLITESLKNIDNYRSYKVQIAQSRYGKDYSIFIENQELTIEQLISYTKKDDITWDIVETNSLSYSENNSSTEKIEKFYFTKHKYINYYLSLNKMSANDGLYVYYENSDIYEYPELVIEYNVLPKELGELYTLINNKLKNVKLDKLELLKKINKTFEDNK